MKLNRKQAKTLQAVFEKPIRADILWSDIVGLFRAMSAEVTQGRGSRVRVHLNGERAVFHEPHPEKETDKGAVKSVREFLENAGIVEGDNNVGL
ncbi:type II toxin-antitoxin system HicA family toxin [Leptolyngbya sp. FACHB-17]|uniref:type II toxin-antitoxin system HicA family toxin n=1 Tax=unclassified Leptolyngbya TaxID=2650499 RepID=UPI0016814C55|nr:type II toxin-antitoxin system HicA family toxin [Leptolyngbya sp. FACHB-17]MBD2081888.1 type II toxin-antitoxin system HicA family toxin [Leptolyngbya sp. FACHB-17]